MRLLAAIGAFVIALILINLVTDARTAAILAVIVGIGVFFGVGTKRQ